MKQYRQHYKIDRAESRADASLGFLLALVIGVSLAWVLVLWWSS